MMFQPLNAKVEKPNYSFNIDILTDFFPQKTQSAIDIKYGKPTIMGNLQGVATLKYEVIHNRYKFPVIIQVKDGLVQDFFAKLPSYFLHDVFFQSLVNKMGKQKTYTKYGEEALYSWEKDSLKHVYSAACTITCFPIFYTVFPVESKSGFTPLIEKMKQAVPK